MKRKIISTLLCVSMCAALMMGCGQSDKSDTKETKKTEESKDEAKDDKLDLGLDADSVTVATSPGYEPFEFEEDGELKGYDVDIWNEFSERTGMILAGFLDYFLRERQMQYLRRCPRQKKERIHIYSLIRLIITVLQW